MSGHVHMMFGIMQSAYPHVQAGKLKALGPFLARSAPPLRRRCRPSPKRAYPAMNSRRGTECT